MKLSRLFLLYLFLSGLILHVVAASVYMHYQSTGVTPHRYVSKAIQFLDRDSSPTRHIARVARLTLLDAGLITDPIDDYPPGLTTELPIWRGYGASQLRKDTDPRYTPDHAPIASTELDLWRLTQPQQMRDVFVDSVETLEKALVAAKPGSRLILRAGTYRIDRSISLHTPGSAEKPVILRGENIGSVVFELSDDAQLMIEGSYWTVSDLIVRGNCGAAACGGFATAGTEAHALTLRNLFVSGIENLVVGAVGKPSARNMLVDGVTLFGGEVSATDQPLTEQAVRRIDIPQFNNGVIVVCPEQANLPDCDTDTLAQALKQVADGGVVLLRSGTYRQAAHIRRNNVHLLAEPGATLVGKSISGKGALVVNANVTIEGLECSHVKVSDGNGCCVRQEHGDVTLLGVHFHHSQMGMLTGHNGGNIRVLDSYFHDSGYDESGQLGHNLYINSGTFEFIRSWSTAARNGGHELKSRAQRTSILDSFIASLNARDSRLIDAPNGGLLEIKGTVLGEGPRSENQDIVGYGLELKGNQRKYPNNIVIFQHNTIFIDRPQGAQLLNARHVDAVASSDNVVIGGTAVADKNTYFRDRSDAGVPAYPALPLLSIR